MSKFSIFTLFISATIVVITAELLTNEYMEPEVKSTGTTNVMVQDKGVQNKAEKTVAAQPAAVTPPINKVAAEENIAPEEDAGIATPKATITFEMINKAGFTGVSLQVMPFNGMLFESLDLRSFRSVPVIVNNLLINNRDKIASFYEFKAGNIPLTDEIFRMLKEKCGSLIGASINDTSAFGNGSFYINYVERPENAFLVVKYKDTVYALTYQKDYHELIRKLLWEITNN